MLHLLAIPSCFARIDLTRTVFYKLTFEHLGQTNMVVSEIWIYIYILHNMVNHVVGIMLIDRWIKGFFMFKQTHAHI